MGSHTSCQWEFLEKKRLSMDLFRELREIKILPIDDDEWIRDSMSLFFEGEGRRIKALETAEEGLKELKSEAYEIIVVDYKLPGMNGLDYFEQIQELYPYAIRLLISAHGNNEVVHKAKALGIHDFIEKPFTSETIEESLSRLIETSEQK